MSIVKDTKNALNLGKVPANVSVYEQLIDAAAPHFELEGKGLEGMVKVHAQNLMFYDTTMQECRTIENTIFSRLEEIEAQLFTKYSTNRQRIMNATEIKATIKGDPQYVACMEILLEVQHVRRKLEAIVEAFKSMGWSLNNIVKLRVSQLDHVTL